MSIRHQMRQKVEELFSKVLNKFSEGELTVYTIYIPSEGEVDEDSIDIFERKVNVSDKENLKKFYEAVTKVSLENDVKGLKIYGYAVEKDGEITFFGEEKNEEVEEIAKELIERMKEEV